MARSSEAEPRVRSSVLHSVTAATRDWAVAQGRAPASTHAPTSDDPYAWIPLRDYLAFFEGAAQRHDEPNLGLELCRRFQPSALGPLGVLFSTASSIADGFAHLSAFLGAWQEGTDAICEQDKALFSWSYRVRARNLRGLRRQDALFTIGATICWLRLRLGPHWHPSEIHFEDSAPDDVSPLRQFFKAPIYFGQETNRILIDNDDAGTTFRDAASAVFFPFMQRHLSDLMEDRGLPAFLVERVQAAVAARLGTEPVTLATIGKAVGLAERTLQRKLALSGTSLRAIVRDERERRARELCARGQVPVARLAEQLGYSEASSACRGIKAWTGASPRELGKRGSLEK